MIIAVDFDGTICENKYPDIGDEMPGALRSLRALKTEGHTIILWTCRCGYKLEDALVWLKVRGFKPHWVNQSDPQMIARFGGVDSRKIYADFYIDDRAVNIRVQPWSSILHDLTGFTLPETG